MIWCQDRLALLQRLSAKRRDHVGLPSFKDKERHLKLKERKRLKPWQSLGRFGIIGADDHPTQCYGRNFSSQMIPPPPGDPAKNPYTTPWHPDDEKRDVCPKPRLGYEMRKGSEVNSKFELFHKS